MSAFQPLFSEERIVVVADMFKPLVLQCQAHADPIPFYEWSRNNTIASGARKMNNGVDLHNRITFTMVNVSWSDRGTYFCNAWNSKGYKYKKYEVIVNRKSKFYFKYFEILSIRAIS